MEYSDKEAKDCGPCRDRVDSIIRQRLMETEQRAEAYRVLARMMENLSHVDEAALSVLPWHRLWTPPLEF